MYECEFIKKSHSLKLNSRVKWCWQIKKNFSPLPLNPIRCCCSVCSNVWPISSIFAFFVRIDCYCYWRFFFSLAIAVLCCCWCCFECEHDLYKIAIDLWERWRKTFTVLPACHNWEITHTHKEMLNIDGNGIQAV